jgi:hypothetical protein
MEELVKEPKLWELGSLTNSFGFWRSTVMSENQSFDFLKIADQGSIILRSYLLVLSLEKKENRTTFYFGKYVFQNGKNSGF